ncbi:ABC transporter substrate-binding protein [Kushneria indalinina]|uniref:Carbohydrate ABC transporter substrate-binding protein (CUT1 family) n=1 Tax=Kushneria indalinina DSM 14324 TaxID=1122140 RepID=A0A3D9DYN2_9GAMM|nr:sugar ABC transporter substrate-binding protein [Kushneria indalinina]REC95878.1 carbohydrate ABC transporter substrate-binding protein (CUT1 family) [Kushneria indalinina DSM 14324]
MNPLKIMFLSALGLSGSWTMAHSAPVELDLWTIDQPGEYHYVMAREFDQQHADITINVRTVQFRDVVNDLARAVATGNGPDVTYIDNPDMALFAPRHLLLDLAPYVRKSDIVDIDRIFPGPLASVRFDDSLYGLPRGSNTLALYYNADMFEAAGLDPDQPPTTWEQLYQYAKALTDSSENVYGLAFSAINSEEGTFQFLPWVQMGGGDYNNIATPGAKRALTLWTRLIEEGLASRDTLIRSQYESTGTFNAGNAAMAISGPWELPRMSEEADFNYRVAMLPVPEKKAKRASALGEGVNTILANTRYPKEAFEFLEFMHANMDRVWNEFGMLPASRVEVKDPNFPQAYAVFDESMKYARTRGPTPEWQKISQTIQQAVQSALTGQVEPAVALENAQLKIDRILD